jgi:uncharacterized membrane protein (DUF2068 family)
MIETSEEQGQHTEFAADAATSPGQDASSHHSRGLLAIGVFKLSKAMFFLALGVGALHLVHRNIGDLFLRVATMLHFDPEGQLVGMLEDKADLISGHQLRRLSEASLLYAGVSLIEGIGLMLEKTWAEYLTLTLTIGALPWELYELVRKPTPIHVGLAVINLAVLAYLLWFIRRHRQYKAARAAGGQAS